jgi:hypothetical protein
MRTPTFSLRTAAFMATGAVLLFKSMASLAALPFDCGDTGGAPVRIVGLTDNGQRLCLLHERSPRRVRQIADGDGGAAAHSDYPLLHMDVRMARNAWMRASGCCTWMCEWRGTHGCVRAAIRHLLS